MREEVGRGTEIILVKLGDEGQRKKVLEEEKPERKKGKNYEGSDMGGEKNKIEVRRDSESRKREGK